MIEWGLFSWLLINGVWVQGDKFDGWGHMMKPTKELCMTSAENANSANKDNPFIKFTCEPLNSRGA